MGAGAARSKIWTVILHALSPAGASAKSAITVRRGDDMNAKNQRVNRERTCLGPNMAKQKEESMETMTVRNTAMTTAVDKKEQELTDMKLAQDIAAATF